MKKLLQDYISKSGIAYRVKCLIKSNLSANWKEDKVAEHLGISARSLRRQPNEFDTSFRNILDAARLQISRQWLNTGEKSLDDTASCLGYKETKNPAYQALAAQLASPAQYLAYAAPDTAGQSDRHRMMPVDTLKGHAVEYA